MVLQEYKPSPLLAECIRTYRLVCYNLKMDGAIPVKPYPPRPEHCLSFYPRDAEYVEYGQSGTKTGKLPVVLFGQQTELTHRFVGSDFLLIQVVFHPGGLYRFTGIPSPHLTNQYLDANTVFSPDIKYINEKILHCSSYTAMIGVVERFLMVEFRRHFREIHPLDKVLTALFSSDTIPPVDALARNSYLSARQMERVFKQRMGVSPKYYLKVLRFENAFRIKNKFPHWDWLRIALHCGYYDYQHLAKDYKELTGFSPTVFHQMDMNAPERLFGEADTY